MFQACLVAAVVLQRCREGKLTSSSSPSIPPTPLHHVRAIDDNNATNQEGSRTLWTAASATVTSTARPGTGTSPPTLSKIVRRRGGVREINESFDSEMTGAPSQDGSLVRVHTCP